MHALKLEAADGCFEQRSLRWIRLRYLVLLQQIKMLYSCIEKSIHHVREDWPSRLGEAEDIHCSDIVTKLRGDSYSEFFFNVEIMRQKDLAAGGYMEVLLLVESDSGGFDLA